MLHTMKKLKKKKKPLKIFYDIKYDVKMFY